MSLGPLSAAIAAKERPSERATEDGRDKRPDEGTGPHGGAGHPHRGRLPHEHERVQPRWGLGAARRREAEGGCLGSPNGCRRTSEPHPRVRGGRRHGGGARMGPEGAGGGCAPEIWVGTPGGRAAIS